MHPQHVLMVSATSLGAGGGGGGESMDILSLIMNASGVVMGVLFLLISLSVVSWFIIGYKGLYYGRATRQSVRFLESFWNTKRLDAVYADCEALDASPLAQMFKAGYVELTKISAQKREAREAGLHEGDDLENVERSLRRAYTAE